MQAATAPAAEVRIRPQLEDLLAKLQEQRRQLSAQAQRIGELTQRTERAEQAAERANEAAAMALKLELEVEGDQEQALSFYGFMDMAFRKLHVPQGSRLKNLISDSSSFTLGNVNFYVDAKPNEQLRALTEVRVTLYPHGSTATGFHSMDTRVYDPT